jgi:hypothetical protein
LSDNNKKSNNKKLIDPFDSDQMEQFAWLWIRKGAAGGGAYSMHVSWYFLAFNKKTFQVHVHAFKF